MMRAPILLLLVGPSVTGQQTTGSQTHGTCSPIITENRASVSVTCSGVDAKEIQRLVPILNRILKQQLDPNEVMAKLDELLTRQKRQDEVLAETNRNVSSLVRERAPRVLSAFQMAQIQKRIARFAGTTLHLSIVTGGPDGEETLRFGSQLVSTLERAGWHVKISYHAVLGVAGLVRTGSIVVNGCQGCDHASILFSLLKDADLPVQMTDFWGGEQPSMSVDLYPLR